MISITWKKILKSGLIGIIALIISISNINFSTLVAREKKLTSISFDDKSTIKIKWGESYTIAGNIKVYAQYSDNTKEEITNSNELIWRTYNPAIASVSGNEAIKGLKEGNTYLRVTYKNKNTMRYISVFDEKKLVSIKFTDTSTIKIPALQSYSIDGNISVMACYSDNSFQDITSSNELIWSVKNSSIASLPGNRTIYGIKKNHSTYLKVKYKNKSATRNVYVCVTPETRDVNKIFLTDTSAINIPVNSTISIKDYIILKASYDDNTTEEVTNSPDVTYNIKNSSIALLPGNGTISALKTGSTTLEIIYKYHGKTLKIKKYIKVTK